MAASLHALARTPSSGGLSLVSELCACETAYHDCLITTTGRLLTGFSLPGVDPSSFDAQDHLAFSLSVDSIFSGISESVTLTQCRLRLPASPATFSRHPDAMIDKLRRQRERHLSGYPFLDTHTHHFLDIGLDDTLKPGSMLAVARNALLSPFSRDARAGLKNALSPGKTLQLLETDLREKHALLAEALETTMARWSSLSEPTRLSAPDILQVVSRYLGAGERSVSPVIEDFDDVSPWIGDGDIAVVQIGPYTCLRLGGPNPVYCRVASIVALGRTQPGQWSRGWDPVVTDLPFPHAMTLRWRKLGQIETAMLFSVKRRQLERSSTSVSSVINTISGKEKKPEHLSTKVRRRFAELDEADAMEVRWTHSEATFLIWGRTEDEIAKRSRILQNACQALECKLVWESTNIANAFRAMLPTGSGIGLRRMITNSAQNASLSIAHARANGAEPDRTMEPLDVFPTPDQSAFSYSPWVGGRALTLGIGPTRSGKTFLKNALALQTLRFNAWYFALDVDPGTAPLAEMLGNRAAYFAIGDNRGSGRAGFNLFSSCQGPDDIAWRAHWLRQLTRMFTADGGARPDEKQIRILDQATESVLALPEDHQTLSHYAAHLPPDLASRLSRWLRAEPAMDRHSDGQRAWLTDCETDIYHSACHFQVFNFAALRDDDILRAIAYAEVFYRITRIFENDAERARPKWLDVDEAHIPLSDPEFAHWIVRGARTWNKFRVAPSMWSQALNEFTEIQNFEAIRGAASTLMFTANPSMPKGEYRKRLGLSDGEIDAISSLVPRRELYIIQREKGISRKVDVRTDEWTELLLRSDPELVQARNALTAKHGLVYGIDRLLEQRRAGELAA